jgi:ribosomal protein S18 acetylase RimI-like enzyme
MPIRIRRALPQDAQAIVELIAASFHEEANPAHIQALIEGGEHLTFVAEGENVVGFIDGFYTDMPHMRQCMELDLLAVHPEHSGKGIGKTLINAFGEASEHAQKIRALVAITNIPMHHAMQNTGYQLQEQAMSLYIASEGKAESNSQYTLQLIAVKTFTYTGIWLEGKVTKDTIKAAHARRELLGLDVVGTVIPSDAQRTIKTLQASGFEFIKEFQWWEKELFPMPRRLR